MNSLRSWARWMLCGIAFAALAIAATTAAPAAPPGLPAFAGWQKTQSAVTTAAGWGLPAPESAVMAEFGLRSVERGVYRRGDRTIQVEGLRFRDAGGAYGAFTYYCPTNFHAFDIGQPHALAESGDTHILFTRGDWLVRVTMDELTAMTAAEMRQLEANLGPSAGNENQLPSLPYYLPRAHLEANSVRYVEGPAGFAAACTWLPPASVGFDMGAEAVVARYDQDSTALAEMAVIAYPTPDIARSHLAALLKLGGIKTRRSGPILVLLHGAATANAAANAVSAGDSAAASALLDAVYYDADLTRVPPTPVGIDALPSLILGIFMLCGLIIAVAVVVGLLTGALRVAAQRFLPQRFHKLEQENLIRLHLQ